MNRVFRVVIDQKSMVLLTESGTTLEEAWESMRSRFGAHRVTEVTPLNEGGENGDNLMDS